MAAQYRARGMTTAIGRPSISYTEGACVGGGSQVNSGIYHPPPSDVIDRWADERSIPDLSSDAFETLAARVEKRLDIRADESPGPSGAILARGADALGWNVVEPRRWVNRRPDGSVDRRGMRETYLRDAIASGASIVSECKVLAIRDEGGGHLVITAVRKGTPVEFSARHVVLAAGATQTPFLLSRSGLGGAGVGKRLRMHPTIKAVGVFEEVATRYDEVAATQVREFSPAITIGHAASRPGLTALALANHPRAVHELCSEWDHASVYYAATCGDGSGGIRVVPRSPEPVVQYGLAPGEASALTAGLARLLHVLLAAGASHIYPSFPGAPIVRDEGDVAKAIAALRIHHAPLMTVHLCGSVPLGSDAGTPSAVDPWGRLLAEPRITVNDASLIPSAPGVNPQGLVSAMALRNAEHLARELNGGDSLE
jgi:choline dehydrogenase-like flavoprotein